MLMQGLISWWYTDGFGLFGSKLWTKLGDTIDFFSIGSLVRTLFAPYRQIAANEKGESIDARFAVFIDRLVSRIVGGVTRILIVLFGFIVIILQAVISLASLIIWPILPIIPIFLIYLALTGVSL